MDSLGLELESVDNLELYSHLPPVLMEKCAALSVRPDTVKSLVQSMQVLSGVFTDVEASLRDIRGVLDEDEAGLRALQEAGGAAEVHPAAQAQALAEIRRDLDKYAEAHEKASFTNTELHRAMNLHISNLRLLGGPLDSLRDALPRPQLNEEEVAGLQCMKRILGKVQEMRDQRGSLEKQLRDLIQQDDITSSLRVFEEQLKKYEQVKVYIEQNLAAQDNILKALTEANVQYATVRKGLAHTEQQWTATVQTLVASYEAYEDLMKKSQEGKEFYDDLEAKASREALKKPPARPTAAKPTLKAKTSDSDSACSSLDDPELAQLNAAILALGGDLPEELRSLPPDIPSLPMSAGPEAYLPPAAAGSTSLPWPGAMAMGPHGSPRFPANLPPPELLARIAQYPTPGGPHPQMQAQGPPQAPPQAAVSGYGPPPPQVSHAGPVAPARPSTTTVDSIQAPIPSYAPKQHYPRPPGAPSGYPAPPHMGAYPQFVPHPGMPMQGPVPGHPPQQGQASLPSTHSCSLGSRIHKRATCPTLSTHPSPSMEPKCPKATSPHRAPAGCMPALHPAGNQPYIQSGNQPYIQPGNQHIPPGLPPHHMMPQQPKQLPGHPGAPQQQMVPHPHQQMHMPPGARPQMTPASHPIAPGTQNYMPSASQPMPAAMHQQMPGGPMPPTSLPMQQQQQPPLPGQLPMPHMPQQPMRMPGQPQGQPPHMGPVCYPGGPPMMPPQQPLVPQQPLHPQHPQAHPTPTIYPPPSAPPGAPQPAGMMAPPHGAPVPPAQHMIQPSPGGLPAALATNGIPPLAPSPSPSPSPSPAPSSLGLTPQQRPSPAPTPGGAVPPPLPSPSRQNSNTDDLLSSSPESQPGGPKAPTNVLQPTKADPQDGERRKKSAQCVTLIQGDPYQAPERIAHLNGELDRYRAQVDALEQPSESEGGLSVLDARWKELQDGQEKDARQLSIAIARCYTMKNRNQDIMPYDVNRVVLRSGKDDYINASYVEELSAYCPRLIATQAPLSGTAADFWLMVYEQKVSLVVMLGKVLRYFPTVRGQQVAQGPITLTLTTQKATPTHVERMISLQYREQSLKRTVVHLQYTSWPEL
ncbi:hypothetical protein CRUP_014212 [Coryphaenoides rupestris]|nr:hypothetical protein CRUP_014212 [Coryphaenoides rupestris]